MKRLFLVMGLLFLLSLSVSAQEREMHWENVTALYFAATNGTDRENVLQQYLLFDATVLDKHTALINQYETFCKEFGHMQVNQAVPEGLKEFDEGIAKVKQLIKEHPEMADDLKAQLKEIEAHRSEFAGYIDKSVTNYTYDPATILKQLTQLAVNQKTYTGYRDIGNNIFAVKTGLCYGPIEPNTFKPVQTPEKYWYMWGAIDFNGRQVMPARYKNFAETYPNQDLIILETKDSSGKKRAGACGYDGRVRIPFDYDEPFDRAAMDHDVEPAVFYVYIFIKNGKYGFVDTNGKVLQPCVYQHPEPYGDGWLVTKDGKNYGMVDHKQGRLMVPLKYASLWDDFSGGFSLVRHDGKLDIFDDNFNLVRTEPKPQQ